MKKLIILCWGWLIVITPGAAIGFQVHYEHPDPDTHVLTFSTASVNFRTVNLNGQDYIRIVFPSRVVTTDAGFAELPFTHANIHLPPLQNASLEITGLQYSDYTLEHHPVPSRGIIYRDQDPSTIPYRISPESLQDRYYPGKIAELTDPFIIKDVRGVTVYVYPFQYNGATRTLRVYHQVTIRVTLNNTEPVNPLLMTSGKYFPEMEALYRSVFINYETPLDYPTIGEAGQILVITTSRDEAAIQPYINWKREKGFVVHKEVVATGTNVKSLIQQKYNANPSILYVQLVGDWAEIKSDLGGGANAPMDPMLGCVVGNDFFPDIAIGRFSANSADHVTIQVNKTINYEKTPSGNWYDKAIGIGSNEGAGIGDDGEIDWQHIDIIYNYKLDPFTYEGHFPIYAPNATSLMVKSAVESGASIINYCGHGSTTSWGTTGFNNTNVNSLTNGNKLPFIFSVACVNGAFHTGECFAEAWLKKQDGGAVLALMSTINQPWTPPMRGQDYFNDLLTGGYNYNINPGNGINTSEGRTILGSIILNGLILMYTESATTADLQTIQTWTTFGDASLQARTMPPKSLSLSNTSLMSGTPFQTTVTSMGQPVKNALVALSQNGVYVSGYTGINGSVTINHNFVPGQVLLVVTAFNHQTIYQTIQCTSASSAAVYLQNVSVNDTGGNNNGQLDYGETAGLHVSMKNLGNAPADNVVLNLATSDQYISILNGIAFLGYIAPGRTITVQNAFTIQVSSAVPDQHVASFNLTAFSGNNSWQSSFTLPIRAGILTLEGYSIADQTGNNNGRLDPGETAYMIIQLKNTGGASITNAVGLLNCSSPYLTLYQTQYNYGQILPGETAEGVFQVSANINTPPGHPAGFQFNATANLGLTLTSSFNITVGQIPVLIIDLDGNHNSWDKIAAAIAANGLSYEVSSTIPANLSSYASLFVCLGIYPNNTVLSATQGQILASYLNQGGKIYLEGGDTWYYDTPTVLHPMFKIIANSDGSGDLGTIIGHTGTFTQGMSFTYSGDNSWIDRISAGPGAMLILSNVSPSYGTGVAYNGNSYRTIGVSHEFGGLNGNRTALMAAYLDFFQLLPPPPVVYNLSIPEGWSGISLPVIPTTNNLQNLFQPIQNQLVILQSLSGMYFPSMNINTIGTWNFQQGYKIKMNSQGILPVTGYEISLKQVNFSAGWNIIPVLVNCEIPVTNLTGNINQVEIIKEVAGTGIFWPDLNINTLGTVKPGKSYLVKTIGSGYISYPACND